MRRKRKTLDHEHMELSERNREMELDIIQQILDLLKQDREDEKGPLTKQLEDEDEENQTCD